jgi:hypothetical protein
MPRKKLPNCRAEQDGLVKYLPAAVQKLILKFPELAVLDPAQKQELSAALEQVLRYVDTGVPSERADVSRDACVRVFFFADIRCAMLAAGLQVTFWRRDVTARAAPNGESLYFRLARAAAKLVGLKVPRDAFRLAKQAELVVYTRGAENAPQNNGGL